MYVKELELVTCTTVEELTVVLLDLPNEWPVFLLTKIAEGEYRTDYHADDPISIWHEDETVFISTLDYAKRRVAESLDLRKYQDELKQARHKELVEQYHQARRGLGLPPDPTVA